MSNNFLSKLPPYKLALHGVRMPTALLDDETYKGLGVQKNISSEDLLKLLCKIGFENRLKSGQIKNENIDTYRNRFKLEFGTIKEGGFIDYFILLWDIIQFINKNNIPKGAARGSAAGCLIFYLLGVTEIDPIKYDLYFERFLSKARIKKTIIDNITYLDGSLVPDCDLDISNSGREQVVNYFLKKYEGKSCKLSTYSTLTSKILIKECGKIVAELSESKMNEVSNYIESVFGKVKELEESYKENEHFKDFCDNYPEVYKIAQKLHGLIKNKSSHASGYLVSYDLLEDCIPVELGSHGEIVSSYDMYDATEVAIKVDLLGLQDITLIYRTCEAVGIDPLKIDVDDSFIYDQLKDLRAPYGLFQIGADCNYRVTQKVRPRDINELSAVTALARPGALAYVDKFADYVNKNEEQSVNKFFDDVLKETGQIPLYQEQTMAMSNKIGFTLDEAETLRRIIGKKKREEMPAWEEKVRNKVKENNLDSEVADVLWKVLNDSASYSFNKSHSVSYASLAALSVYLKFKYPLDFFLESLKMAREKQDVSAEIALIQSELKYFNINLLPPDLVKSQLDFSKENGNLRFGLSAIKGISDKTIESLKGFINSDKTNKFEVFQAAKKSGMSIGILSALIQAGCLQSLGENRPALVFEAQLYGLLTDREKVWCLTHGHIYNYSLFDILNKSDNLLDDKGKKLFKDSRIETIKKKADPYREIFKINNKYPQFASYFFEKERLGFSYSQRLKDIFQKYSANKVDELAKTDYLEEGDNITVVGEVLEIEERKSKKNKDYLKINLCDESGQINCLLFDPKFTKFKNDELFPVVGNIVILDLKKWNETFLIQHIKVCQDKVYLRLADLKE